MRMPESGLKNTLWAEDGRGGLSGITRERIELFRKRHMTEEATVSLCCGAMLENPYLASGPLSIGYFGVNYDQALNIRTQLALGAIYKFSGGPSTKRPFLGNASINYLCEQGIRTIIGYERKDEFYNGFGLLQDIQSDSVFISLTAPVSHKTTLDGLYRFLRYTDHNFLNMGVIGWKRMLTDNPCNLNIAAQLEYRNTEKPDIFIYNAAGNIIDIIHPYWCPQQYCAWRGWLEWNHNLSTFDFWGSQKHYYTIRVSGFSDSEHNPGASTFLEWHLDWDKSWSVQASGYLHYSVQWKAVGYWLSIGRHF